MGPEVEKWKFFTFFRHYRISKRISKVHGDVNIDLFMHTHAIEINKVTLPLALCSPVELDNLHGKVNFGVNYH